MYYYCQNTYLKYDLIPSSLIFSYIKKRSGGNTGDLSRWVFETITVQKLCRDTLIVVNRGMVYFDRYGTQLYTCSQFTSILNVCCTP